MRIAINASDLDHSRIDGTRIYIQNMLKKFGSDADDRDQFLIYHRSEFNPELRFPLFENYKIIRKPFPFWWTQTRFALEIRREKPEVLWMPMHSLPYLRSRKTKTVVTIHDLAFKFFPDHFPKKDLRKLNCFTDYAVRNSDRLIAISESTKKDLLRLYPEISGDKIRVIHHGYDKGLYNENISDDERRRVREKYGISRERYIIFVGALQPRKNIATLVDAFASLGQDSSYNNMELVIAGDAGWMYEDLLKKAQKTSGVVVAGKFETRDLPGLMSGAEVFVLPSLYEGFGLPAVEAMACGIPVIAADNSSLTEIVGEAGVLYKPNKSPALSQSLREVLGNSKLKNDLRKKSLERAKDFSWERCARETLEWLTSWQP